MDHQIAPEKAALERAARVLGGQAALASLLGYADRRNVTPWFKTSRAFPAEYCPVVERATREKHRQDPEATVVTCEELRPDVPWSVLRRDRRKDKSTGGRRSAEQEG